MIYLDYSVKRIKHSAMKIFYEKGFNGARVSEIAQDAGVSKSLLHYYFRTKEQIFKIIIEDSINLVVKNMSPILVKDLGFYELIDQFIYNILILFKDNKNLFSFIINEYNQNFEKIKFALKPIFGFFREFENKINTQSQYENIKINDTKHFIVNLISLCGWQIIGVNIIKLEKELLDENTYIVNITEIKDKIFQNVLNSF